MSSREIAISSDDVVLGLEADDIVQLMEVPSLDLRMFFRSHQHFHNLAEMLVQNQFHGNLVKIPALKECLYR